MTKKGPAKDLDFLFEMGTIRHIERMWKRFLNPDFANLAEHHFRVFWIAMVIAAREKADTGKIAKMVLVHDIAESRTGDVDYVTRQYVEKKDKLAIEDILSDTSIEKEFLELWEEYEKRDSLEAKIVKDADTLDVDLELAEQAARGHSDLPKIWHKTRKGRREKLYTQTAKELFDQIQLSSPHNWHLKGRNRVNSGDWKK